jgi:ABC-2 type transport system ATP-binding protein
VADHAVEIEHVSKRFVRHSEPAKTLKERVLTWSRNQSSEFHALHDITFDVGVGETVGLLGHNGSGKSTLLKCIAGTIRPSEGVVRVRGRMAALLELGAGFHPDLTGRENIYLNGSILGFSRQQIDRIFDEIVEFAELEDFIDSQVKHYSSGMYARLGFAVAVNVEPEILLIDEVLSVGDEAFQAKCLDRIRRLQRDGRTILLVTHAPDLARQLCDKVVVLDHGEQIFTGDTGEAARVYRQSLEKEPNVDPAQEEGTPPPEEVSGLVRIGEVTIDPPTNGVAFEPGDTVTIRTTYSTDRVVDGLRARLIVHAHDGILLTNVSSYDLGEDIGTVSGAGEIVFSIRDLPLMDGRYVISVILQDNSETFEHDRRDRWTFFDVQAPGPYTGRIAFRIDVAKHTAADA